MADAVALLDTASTSVGLVDPEGLTSVELTEAILLAQRLRAQVEAAESRP